MLESKQCSSGSASEGLNFTKNSCPATCKPGYFNSQPGGSGLVSCQMQRLGGGSVDLTLQYKAGAKPLRCTPCTKCAATSYAADATSCSGSKDRLCTYCTTVGGSVPSGTSGLSVGRAAPRGTECRFPFSYKNVSYGQCIGADNGGIAWCSTMQGGGENTRAAGTWGNCLCGDAALMSAKRQGSSDQQRTASYVETNAYTSSWLQPVSFWSTQELNRTNDLAVLSTATPDTLDFKTDVRSVHMTSKLSLFGSTGQTYLRLSFPNQSLSTCGTVVHEQLVQTCKPSLVPLDISATCAGTLGGCPACQGSGAPDCERCLTRWADMKSTCDFGGAHSTCSYACAKAWKGFAADRCPAVYAEVLGYWNARHVALFDAYCACALTTQRDIDFGNFHSFVQLRGWCQAAAAPSSSSAALPRCRLCAELPGLCLGKGGYFEYSSRWPKPVNGTCWRYQVLDRYFVQVDRDLAQAPGRAYYPDGRPLTADSDGSTANNNCDYARDGECDEGTWALGNASGMRTLSHSPGHCPLYTDAQDCCRADKVTYKPSGPCDVPNFRYDALVVVSSTQDPRFKAGELTDWTFDFEGVDAKHKLTLPSLGGGVATALSGLVVVLAGYVRAAPSAALPLPFALRPTLTHARHR